MKDYFRWHNRCGDCKHKLLDHIKTGSFVGTVNSNKIPKKFLNEFGHCQYCECREWVPKDNLDRVEYLVEKRKLI